MCRLIGTIVRGEEQVAIPFRHQKSVLAIGRMSPHRTREVAAAPLLFPPTLLKKEVSYVSIVMSRSGSLTASGFDAVARFSRPKSSAQLGLPAITVSLA